jgi:hypothetical protein
MPRRARIGAITEAFIRENPGKLPPDFDPHYFSSAHPDMMYPGFLRGDEPIETIGILPGGNSVSRLPGYRPFGVAALSPSGIGPVIPRLDTLTLFADRKRVELTWRLTVPIEATIRALVLSCAVPPHGSDLVRLGRAPKGG